MFLFQLYYALMSFILSFFLSKTSINGILNRGEMFLFSTKQLRYFLNIPTEWNPIDKRVLDLGAGDGRVTKKLAAFYANVHTTEISQVRMEKKTLFSNLHYNPRKLLRDIYEAALRSNCSVLVAVVLPIDQYVEFHPSKRTNRADVRLKVKGNTIEQQASSLVENEFIPLGFQIVRWTKLPYLCEGDLNSPFYVLEDVVFLLHPMPTETLRLSSSNGFTYVSNEL
ncbi:unnamed protein product [Angiostrongylus costaricensis]|uniref:Methyltransferase-like protein 9 n=1 Tax=Angiostrongylus costaricensis TaxID=334426 RepID=A0A0R3PTM6_ANGCS|nr:unnamed protein product [Angiostrongylus costaricensis]